MRLKMRVNWVKKNDGSNNNASVEETSCEEVWMTAACDDLNKEWHDATPVGDLHFIINNPAAFGQLKTGQDIMVDLTPI